VENNALNNLIKTPEAQRLISLLGENGFNQYLLDLYSKMNGNFDETVKHMNVHAMAVQKMQMSGANPTYDLLKAAPTQQDITGGTQNPYPVAAPRVEMPPTPAPRVTYTPPRQELVQRPGQTTQPIEIAPAQQSQQQYRLSSPPPQSPLVTAPNRITQPSATQPQAQPQVLGMQTGSPNYVNAFQPGAYSTAGIGGYPGHQGEDYAYDPGSSQRAVTNPMGGIPFGGFQSGGYGNYLGVIGANPQEAAQMSPEERQAIMNEVNAKMPTASGLRDMNIRGKNVAILGHLANPTYNQPDYLATGSAQLQMGSTGNSSGLHTHVEMMGPSGDLQSYADLLKKYGGKSVPKKSGPTGGGANAQFAGLLSQASNAFNSIARPIQSVSNTAAYRPLVAPPTPKPTPTPSAPRVSNVVSAPKVSPIYSAPQVSATYSGSSAPRSTPTPTPAPSYNSYSSKPVTYSSGPMMSTPAPRSVQPMMSTYKAPVSYSRPAPQQTFFQSAIKTISNLFR